jgi:plasmid stabilization system protein ParE
MPRTISNGSATTSHRNGLIPHDAWRSPLSSASGHWRRFRTWGALVGFEARARLRFLRSPSSPSTKFAEQIVVLRILHGAQRWPSAR